MELKYKEISKNDEKERKPMNERIEEDKKNSRNKYRHNLS